MVTGSQTIDGKVYNFASSGESGFNIGGHINETFEKTMQVGLTAFFFGLLATNTVFGIPQVANLLIRIIENIM